MTFNFKIAIFWFLIMCAFAGHPALADNPGSGVASMAPAAQGDHGVTLWELLKAGGLAMLVLGLLSVAATALIVYDFMTIKSELTVPQRFAEDLIQRLESRDDKGVRAMCAGRSNILA